MVTNVYESRKGRSVCVRQLLHSGPLFLDVCVLTIRAHDRLQPQLAFGITVVLRLPKSDFIIFIYLQLLSK